MSLILDIMSWALILAGSALMIVGALGLWRLPDFFTRIHAASIVDTLASYLIILGLIFQTSDILLILKLVLILGFFFFTSPMASHALARAALIAGMKPEKLTQEGMENE